MEPETPTDNPDDPEDSRRLHPRLRMIRNGDGVVNELRSSISTTVVTRRRKIDEPQQTAAAALAYAQQQAGTLDPTELDLAGRGRLTKRPKLWEGERSDDSFVNIFLDVTPRRTDPDRDDASDAQIQEQATVSDVVRAVVAALGDDSDVQGCVIRRGNLISATVPVQSLHELEKDNRIDFVAASEALKLDVPAGTESRRQPRRRNVGRRDLHHDGDNVIIGIIDVGGFDFAHPDFLDDAGQTRYVAIWDQGGRFRPAPTRFGYGSEITARHLKDAVIQSNQPNGLPAVLFEPQSQRTRGSHGTHVASIAAGNAGVCPRASIAAVIVDIPAPETQADARRFTFSDTSRIVHAVEYLLDVAESREQPISINISLGTNGGAHDGSSGVSRWLDSALATPGRAISAAAGNAGQESPADEEDLGWVMGRIHTSGTVRSRGLEVDLEWVVVGNGIADISENELEIWYSPQDRFSVSVQPPGETRWYETRPREFRENHRLSDGTTLSVYNELYHPNNGANYIAIYLSPNLDPANLRGVRAGVWKVRLRGEEVRNGNFHAWIERDDPIEIGRRNNQRFFQFPSFFTRSTMVDSHSISSLACGQNIIAVANVDSATRRVNITSSQGPTRDGREKPDIAADGTNIVAANGFADGAPDWISMTGTSMASPYVAGVIGLMLSANANLTSSQCAGILQRTAQPLPGISFEWQNDAGYGQIDPVAAVKEAATFTLRRERRR